MKVKVSGNLARFVDYKRELEIGVVEGDTIKDVFVKLVAQYPALKNIIYDKSSQVKKGYLVSLNGQKIDVNASENLVENGDSLDIFTAIAGG